ncbi:MAG: glycosyltransferase 87 family protein [Actinocrinis sp.]
MPQHSRRTLYVVLGWLASRVPLYLISTGHLWGWYGQKNLGDVNTYYKWVVLALNHGALPTDNSWQYPPLVGPLLLLPKILPGTDYHQQFVKLAFVADAVVMLTLLWTARRRGSWLGPWFWILSVPFLGPLIYGRFDVYSALFVVVALAALGKGVQVGGSDGMDTVDGAGGTGLSGAGAGRRELNGRRWLAGALIGLGAAVKVWPGLTVFGLPRSRRGWQTIAAAVAAGGVATLVCMFAFTNGTWFLHTQGSRGIEIESVWALPLLLADRAHLWHATVRNHYGSIEVIGHGVGAVEKLALLSTVLVFALLAWWWWRKAWRPAVVADATLVATLLMIVTSRVISPQYLIWLLATAAFCLLNTDSSQRRSALLILISLPITQWIFPYNFNALRQVHIGPLIVLIVRDALLVAAAVIGFRDLWRDTVSGPVWPRRRAPKAAVSSQNAEPASDTTTV